MTHLPILQTYEQEMLMQYISYLPKVCPGFDVSPDKKISEPLHIFTVSANWIRYLREASYEDRKQ